MSLKHMLIQSYQENRSIRYTLSKVLITIGISNHLKCLKSVNNDKFVTLF
jgi:hypothetical protein